MLANGCVFRILKKFDFVKSFVEIITARRRIYSGVNFYKLQLEKSEVKKKRLLQWHF